MRERGEARVPVGRGAFRRPGARSAVHRITRLCVAQGRTGVHADNATRSPAVGQGVACGAAGPGGGGATAPPRDAAPLLPPRRPGPRRRLPCRWRRPVSRESLEGSGEGPSPGRRTLEVALACQARAAVPQPQQYRCRPVHVLPPSVKDSVAGRESGRRRRRKADRRGRVPARGPGREPGSASRVSRCSRRHVSRFMSISAMRDSTRVLISSRMGRTASTPWPAGSSSFQSR